MYYVHTIYVYSSLIHRRNKASLTYSGNNFGIETVATPCHKADQLKARCAHNLLVNLELIGNTIHTYVYLKSILLATSCMHKYIIFL